MRKAFEVVPSRSQVNPEGDQELIQITKMIARRTVIVRTRDCVGQAVIVAGKIITSLLLVRNEQMVVLHIPKCGKTQAIVSQRDEANNIAKLEPVSLSRSSNPLVKISGEAQINRGPIGEIGDPLLLADSRSNRTNTLVGGMSMVIKVCERRERDIWRFDPLLPVGIVGGGIWNLRGEFTGLSLATKAPHLSGFRDRIRFLAVPAEAVLDFAESS